MISDACHFDACMTKPNYLFHVILLLISNTQFLSLHKNIPLLNNMWCKANRIVYQNKFFPAKFTVPLLSPVAHITTTGSVTVYTTQATNSQELHQSLNCVLCDRACSVADFFLFLVLPFFFFIYFFVCFSLFFPLWLFFFRCWFLKANQHFSDNLLR